jgi:hypothetical protein
MSLREIGQFAKADTHDPRKRKATSWPARQVARKDMYWQLLGHAAAER